MARQYKVPTKVAAAIVEHNHATALTLMQLQERMQAAVEALVSKKKQRLLLQVQLLHPAVATRIAHTQQALRTWKNGLHLLATQRTTMARKDLEHLTRRLQGSSQQLCLHQKAQLTAYKRLVAQLAPEATLRRGFALVWQQGKLITRIHQAHAHVPLVTQLADGSISAHIVQIEKSTPPSDETVP
jgi:exodeoxyribonuclease VII large subunit